MLIAIIGGIGSGKSVVCRILSCLGFAVYDTDEHARAIMDGDMDIKRSIACSITPDALCPDGSLDRKAIAEVVFADADKLSKLNAIVHGAVRNDLKLWYERQPAPVAFVETAILYQSGLDRMVDAVWEVTADTDVRLKRVCRRNGLAPEQVMSRIRAQAFEPERVHPCVSVIVNDDAHSLLLQIRDLLNSALFPQDKS